jgi:hypothetical protein
MNLKIVVIDGQGGRMGKMLVEKIKPIALDHEIMAIGTNSIATSAMLKAGADYGATGENPIVWNCKDADIILGPIGIIIANALHGEISPKMAQAVGECKAHKILVPVNKCNLKVMGVSDMSLSDYIDLAVDEVKTLLK